MNIFKNLNKIYIDYIYGRRKSLLIYISIPILFLLSYIYKIVVNLRILLYNKLIIKSKSLNTFVISVGNLTVGGSGKTPAVYLLAFEIKKKYSQNVAILSRGYKGELVNTSNIVSDGKKIFFSPKQCGDEPYMLADKLKGVPVLCGKDRFLSGKLALDTFGSNVLLLDDSYQHLKLKRNFNILLIDSMVQFGTGNIFPLGLLRESVSSVNRADAVIFTKCKNDFDINSFKKRYNITFNEKTLVFNSYYEPTSCIEFNNKDFRDVSWLKGKKVFYFCAIATPESFKNTLIDLGVQLVGEMEFEDHHYFYSEELEEIKDKATKCQADVIITTEKDSVRLKEYLPILFSLWVLKIEMKIVEKERWDAMMYGLMPSINDE